MWLKEWRKRYFILKGNKLYFAQTPQKEPHGVIDLSECLTVKSAEEIRPSPCAAALAMRALRDECRMVGAKVLSKSIP